MHSIAKYSKEKEKVIGFPCSMFTWGNSFTTEENLIIGKAIDSTKRVERINRHLAEEMDYQIVFA